MFRVVSIALVMFFLAFQLAGAQEGAVSPYLDQDAEYDNIGQIITPAQANASAQPDLEYIQRVQAGWNEHGIGVWATCGLKMSSVGTKYQFVVCSIMMHNDGDESVTITQDNFAFVDEGGYPHKAIEPFFLSDAELDAYSLISVTIP